MLRRLTIFLRRGLFGVGVVLLLWWPVSWYWVVQAISPWPFTATELRVQHGHALIIFEKNPLGSEQDASVALWRYDEPPHETPLAFVSGGEMRIAAVGFVQQWVYVPLWQLGVLCIAWPVTSFFLARRRRGRGFEVEQAASETPLPPGEVPSEARR